MKSGLIDFLSSLSFHESERVLFLEIEKFFIENCHSKPLLFLSVPNNFELLELDKCRSVLDKNSRLQNYDKNILSKILKDIIDFKSTYFLEYSLDKMNYYFLNLGHKGNQFFFCMFNSKLKLESEILKAIGRYSEGQLNIIQQFDDLKKSQELIHIDDVTGLYNQRKLYKDLKSFAELFQTNKEPFSILFIDIDHFKKVNDSYGHIVGTRLLEMMSVDVKNLLRDTDLVYRYGGDEFVVLLPAADADSGKMVGERILKKIKSKRYEFEIREMSCSMNLSVSIGVAEFPTDAKNTEEILSIADQMMYEAKESGRGMVCNTKDLFKAKRLKKVNGDRN
jgi:diguanylate cyclase (GGDEF)-like protein